MGVIGFSGTGLSHSDCFQSTALVIVAPPQTFHETKGKKHVPVSTSGQGSPTTFYIKLLCKFLLISHKIKSYHPRPFMIYLHAPQPNLMIPQLSSPSLSSLYLEYHSASLNTRGTTKSYGKFSLFNKLPNCFPK